MKRRDFLKTGVKLGVAVNALPGLLGGSRLLALGRSPLRHALETTSANNGKVLVIVQLQGGNDGLNCLVPVEDPGTPLVSLYKQLRPTLGLDKTADNLLVLPDHQQLAFHGAMSGMSALYGDGKSKMKILQGVGYTSPSLSHFRGTDIWNTATDSSIYASTGWIGRYLYWQNPGYPPQTIQPGSWPLAVQFGNSLSNSFLAQSGGMGIALNALPTQASPGGHNYDPIPGTPNTPYSELEYVRIIQNETETYATTIYNNCKGITNKVSYPTNNALATNLSSIAKIISAQAQQSSGIQTKIYLVTQGSYDTHAGQLTGQAKLLGDLSDALLAFQQDIEAFGVADNVAIMTYSEFGRRPAENGSGTDHGTAAPHFVISTQVIPGITSNDPDLSAGQSGLVAGNMQFTYDFRSVYATMLNEWLLAGDPNAKATIDSVLKGDANGTYSNNLNWQSLGIFKAQPQQSVASGTNATGLMLMENYPNPASGLTTIEYALPATGPVELGIFSMNGAELERIVDARQEAGPQRVSFNTGRLPSGAYVYRLKTASGEVAQRMIVAH